MYVKYLKRVIDFIVAMASIILLSPIILVTSLLVRIKLGSPIIFKQKRPGKNEKIFTLYKFRTMTDAKNEKGELLSDEIRLTNFGKLLRALSLDELPQLLNIVKGDMSFIGPRPLLVEYLKLYSKEQKHRHDVRPGLSGLAQVNGRNAIEWEDKFKFDIEYVNTISLKTDFKILIKSIMVVLKKVGISEKGSVTVTKFKGSKTN